ncbi:conjugal transfer relaxosome DNA-bindin protein TraY (plasmid) [Escherichia coli]|nr:conjugal transfer relaxosome DNA-bindin protein TraY [Escherichia coli]MDM4889786.1 conjugal transfer relaxosome DNA-bindin protein TraY [Escherichia coli]
MVKLKLPVDVESLLIEASNRSGRSRSFEAVIRLKDHLHRYPKFNRAGNIYGKSLVKYLTMRLDDETNQLLIAAKNRSGWCKTDEAADRVIDHLIKFPDFYNSEIFREADKEEDITFNTLPGAPSAPGCLAASGRQARLRQAAAGAPASLRRTRWRGFGLSLRSDA